MYAKLSIVILMVAAGGLFAQSPAEPKLNTVAAKAFTGKVQPVLSNLCADCHAHPKHVSLFKLKPHDPAFNDPQTADANLRAVAPFVDTARPHDSKLLKYATTAHGKATDPPLKAGHPALAALEQWVHWASGPEGSASPTAVPPPPVADKAVVQAVATRTTSEPSKLPPLKATPIPSFAGMKAKGDSTRPNPDDPFDPAGFNKK